MSAGSPARSRRPFASTTPRSWRRRTACLILTSAASRSCSRTLARRSRSDKSTLAKVTQAGGNFVVDGRLVFNPVFANFLTTLACGAVVEEAGLRRAFGAGSCCRCSVRFNAFAPRMAAVDRVFAMSTLSLRLLRRCFRSISFHAQPVGLYSRPRGEYSHTRVGHKFLPARQTRPGRADQHAEIFSCRRSGGRESFFRTAQERGRAGAFVATPLSRIC